eukprot:1427247-Karenia_brevis.AAC.1
MLRKIVAVSRKMQDANSVSSSSSTSSSSSSSCPTSAKDLEDKVELEDNLESWLDWLRRATGIAEGLASKHGVSDWVEEQRRRKWRLAGH